MPFHYDDEYHKAIAKAGEGSAPDRWSGQRRVISRFKSGGAILDLGCSSGGFLSTMSARLWKLHGIELEESTAARARSRTGAEVFVGDIMEAPFPAATFDAITCFDVLEHVYDPRAFLTKIQHWLKPGGIFYTMLPNIESWEAVTFGSYWYGLELPRHLFHFSPRSLRYLLRSLNYREVYLRTSATTYIERSMGYLADEASQKLGIHRSAQSGAQLASVPWRALRKTIRTAAVTPVGHLASWAGKGASIDAVFTKDDDI
jgi:2-polyprenyl-3-methyl-5-hydroxy-6-metoxy-1,4-benzoquinol methylase